MKLRISVEPSDTGYEAYLEERHLCFWYTTDLCGSGETPEEAEDAVRQQVEEWKRVCAHLRYGTRKVVKL